VPDTTIPRGLVTTHSYGQKHRAAVAACARCRAVLFSADVEAHGAWHADCDRIIGLLHDHAGETRRLLGEPCPAHNQDLAALSAQVTEAIRRIDAVEGVATRTAEDAGNLEHRIIELEYPAQIIADEAAGQAYRAAADAPHRMFDRAGYLAAIGYAGIAKASTPGATVEPVDAVNVSVFPGYAAAHQAPRLEPVAADFLDGTVEAAEAAITAKWRHPLTDDAVTLPPLTVRTTEHPDGDLDPDIDPALLTRLCDVYGLTPGDVAALDVHPGLVLLRVTP
jgi:hypothetical protein